MITTKLDIKCIWGGTLTGILLKNDAIATGVYDEKTTKIVGVHGWLDNLNSLLPLATQLIDRHPNYEIYLYDRAGHGFSSHIPKGLEYSSAHHVQDLRIVIQNLGWNKEKFAIIGHSYGAMLGMTYTATYPDEVSSLVAIDALPRFESSPENYFQIHASRIEKSLAFHNKPARKFETDLTFETALELTKLSRTGISDEAARLLTERSVRRDTNNKLHFTRDEALKIVNNKLHFTRDEALKILPLTPSTNNMFENMLERMKASILFVGATKPQWPAPQKSIDLLKEQNPNFEMVLIDGPHHLHMTHTNEVLVPIEKHFNKYLK
ncbi:unnamed protein product [Adineta steineri]|uniref:AB hydrolase-1 domain-containing protein n=1 Tax=Adineta steineri TaxID=433720 RepID=A0A814GMI6_9BILA|nr:unnamed protein product [Adineta steineri]